MRSAAWPPPDGKRFRVHSSAVERRIADPEVAGSIPAAPFSRLAQLVERKTLNLVVVGSSPTVGGAFGFFFCGLPRQDSEIAALEACDKSGSARAAEATLQHCGLWNAPIIRGCGGPRNNESRWLWTRTRRRNFGASSPENTITGRIDEREKPVEDQSDFCKKTRRVTRWRLLSAS